MKKILMIGDNEIEKYLNDGWRIIANAPNPYPQPWIYFCVEKEFTEITKQTLDYRKQFSGKAVLKKNEICATCGGQGGTEDVHCSDCNGTGGL